MEAEGSLKSQCSAMDEEVGLGCTGKYCCCAPKDGKLLPMDKEGFTYSSVMKGDSGYSLCNYYKESLKRTNPRTVFDSRDSH